jgi:hypothetical protein
VTKEGLAGELLRMLGLILRQQLPAAKPPAHLPLPVMLLQLRALLLRLLLELPR